MGLIRGHAAFTWIDSAISMTEQVLLLREPIREIRPAHRQTVYPSDSMDYQVRQVFTIGTGVDELVCRVRFMDDQQGLLNLIKAGTKNITITYHANLNDSLQTHDYKLISPLSPVMLGMDTDRGVHFGDLEVELVLRETS